MKKVIICDTNEKLISQLKKAIGAGPPPTGVEIEFVCEDIIALHEKTPNSRIVTASNPSFSPDGGLDAVLAKKYGWDDPTEFVWNDNLFFVKSVDEDHRATKMIVERALVGVLGYAAKYTMLLTGIGTGAGGLAVDVLEALIKKVFSCADISSADISYANLSSANLSSADISYANLSSADLSSADLSYANISSADLSYANLSYANISSANISSANLSCADLSYANISSADLSSANLSCADISSANLSCANLRSANLSSADLSYANISSADLSYVKSIKGVKHNEATAFFAISCPSDGAFIGWKKARGCIVKLQITEKARRSSATTRKCRCSKAKVLAIYNKKKKVKKVASSYDKTVIYEVGKTVKPKEAFDEDRWNECSSGIHFFITREEAEQWTE